MDDGFGDDDDVENLTASREREKRENFKKGVTEYPDVPDHDHERNPFRPQGADLGLSSGIDE